MQIHACPVEGTVQKRKTFSCAAILDSKRIGCSWSSTYFSNKKKKETQMWFM